MGGVVSHAGLAWRILKQEREKVMFGIKGLARWGYLRTVVICTDLSRRQKVEEMCSLKVFKSLGPFLFDKND